MLAKKYKLLHNPQILVKACFQLNQTNKKLCNNDIYIYINKINRVYKVESDMKIGDYFFNNFGIVH